MRGAILALACAAPASCYWSGQWSAPSIGRFVGVRGQEGCLDVAVAITEDETAPSPIIAYSFGNGCFHQTIVDLAAPRVVAYVGDDNFRVELARDDAGLVKPMQIDALGYGQERIAYKGPAGMAPIHLLCVDLGSIDAHAPHEDWKCLTGYSTADVP